MSPIFLWKLILALLDAVKQGVLEEKKKKQEMSFIHWAAHEYDTFDVGVQQGL